MCTDSETDNEARVLRNIKDQLAKLENRRENHAFSFTDSDRFIDDSEFSDKDQSYAVISDSSILHRIMEKHDKSETLDISHDSDEDFMSIFKRRSRSRKERKTDWERRYALSKKFL